MSAWGQLEQLLTCAICLDRFRNPKLLPCQHTFCMDPCMEGLIDYARRQIKCPECRAEHRIPYNGVQTLPTNVTLMRFLELHRNITGEEPEPEPCMMERCAVCSEKNLVNFCAHCTKKICDECKEAHLDIMRREISRINNQVKRTTARLQETITEAQKNQEKLTHNCVMVKEELDDIVNRSIRDLKLIQERLKNEVDQYEETEMKQLQKLAEDCEQELTTVFSNGELADKYINEDHEWTDAELVEYKEIFTRTLEFLRNFDADTTDFSRRVKLQVHTDAEQLHKTLSNLAELKINAPSSVNMTLGLAASQGNLAPPGSNALMRSQSDHRLAAQFKKQQQESRSMLDISQRFGGHSDNEQRDADSSPYSSRRATSDLYRRYGPGASFEEPEEETGHRPFRSQYARERMNEQQNLHRPTTVRFQEEPPQPPKPPEKVFDVEGASRAPLSGIVKIEDSGRFMERLHESEARSKQKKVEKEIRQQQTPQQPQQTTAPTPQAPRRPPSRQQSEDDVEKQKKANQAAASSSSTTETPAPTTQPAQQPPPIERQTASMRRVTSLQKEDSVTNSRPPSVVESRTGSIEGTPVQSRRGSTTSEDTTDLTALRSRRREEQRPAPAERSSTINSGPKSPAAVASPTQRCRPAMAKTSSLDQERRGGSDNVASRTSHNAPQQTSYYSRLQQQQRPTIGEDDESEEEETSSSESSDEEVMGQPPYRRPTTGDTSPGVKALLNRSAEARKQSRDSGRPDGRPSDGRPSDGRFESSTAGSGFGGRQQPQRDNTKVQQRSGWRNTQSASVDDPSSRSYGGTTSGSRYPGSESVYRRRQSAVDDDEPAGGDSATRYLNRSRSSALLGRYDSNRDESPDDGTSRLGRNSDQRNLSSFRRSQLSRSKSSTEVPPGEADSDNDEIGPISPSYRSRYGGGDSYVSPRYGTDALSRSRSSNVVNDSYRDQSPESSSTTGDHGGGSTSWAQYIRNKYGSNRTGSATGSTGSGSRVAKSRSTHAVYSPRNGSDESASETEEPRRRVSRDASSTSSRTGDGPGGGSSGYGSSGATTYGFPRSTYLQKKRMQTQVGSRGQDPGNLTWPRSLAVGPDNNIAVVDTGNHRVQVFDMKGKLLRTFGEHGAGEGQLDSPAGIAVNRVGQIIVSDRYNNRIQVFDQSGRFIRQFGGEGRNDGKFNSPWGLTTDSLGFIYVCDLDNHRIQVFQSDGTFVGKFGTPGSRSGCLQHPHYIAVSNTNRVIVTDTDNHRVQIFDVNGRSLSLFGSEGSGEGQFKFPRGVAVDDQGYIIVGDSGNNRVQIFQPDGQFLHAFGTWGAGANGEFKGLEDLAVAPNGAIVVCDRENHRVQVF